MPININIGGNVETLIVNGNPVQKVLANGVEVWSAMPTPTYPPYLTFSSPAAFSLQTAFSEGGYWDGTLEYSTDKSTWSTWDSTTIYAAASGGTYYIYLRGIGNTRISGKSSSDYDEFVFSGNDISCNGDIRTLLDYLSPENTTMASHCFTRLFYGSPIISAPSLLAETLTTGCYNSMFRRSTISTLPKINANIFPENCCNSMLRECANIKISETQTGEYQTPYRIPDTGTATAATNSFNYMLTGTGGTFTGNPTVNTTYYTSNTVIG